MGVTRVSGNGPNPTQIVGVPLGTPVGNTPKVSDLTLLPEKPKVVEELPDPKPVEEVKEEELKPKKKNR